MIGDKAHTSEMAGGLQKAFLLLSALISGEFRKLIVPSKGHVARTVFMDCRQETYLIKTAGVRLAVLTPDPIHAHPAGWGRIIAQNLQGDFRVVLWSNTVGFHPGGAMTLFEWLGVYDTSQGLELLSKLQPT